MGISVSSGPTAHFGGQEAQAAQTGSSGVRKATAAATASSDADAVPTWPPPGGWVGWPRRVLRSNVRSRWNRAPSGETGQHGEAVPSGATEPTDSWKVAGPSGPAANQAHRQTSGFVSEQSPREHRAASGGNTPGSQRTLRWSKALRSTLWPRPAGPAFARCLWRRPATTAGGQSQRWPPAIAPVFGSERQPGLTLEMLPGRGKLRRVCAIGKGLLTACFFGSGWVPKAAMLAAGTVGNNAQLRLSGSAERWLETWRTPRPAAGCNKPAGCFAE
jgi:hypothetical protein